jgi:biopolymer transport protein ExbD
LTDTHETAHEELPAIAPRKRFVDTTEMDITPMIDCTFLLLVFFIVCSRPDAQEAIILARAHHGTPIGAKSATVITIAETGREIPPVYLADGRVKENQLPDNLEQQAEQIRQAVQQAVDDGRANVLIKAEKGVPHRDVARITAAASRVAGVRIFYGVADAE